MKLRGSLSTGLIAPEQLRYLRDAERDHDIDFIRLRRFILSALGDAAAYQKVESNKNTSYEEIHEEIRKQINELYTNDLDGQECPVIILAHSVGGHIMSNYIWDIQNPPQNASPDDLSSFEKLEHFAGMITFGCNTPLFTFAYGRAKPIKFPGEKLNADLKSKAKWLNYYDPDDVLGYPLKAINDAYNKVVDEDIPINVGDVLSSWNPVSHANY